MEKRSPLRKIIQSPITNFLFRKDYQVNLAISYLRYLRERYFYRAESPLEEYDLVIVLLKDMGWILRRISQEIAQYFPGKCYFHDSLDPLPRAKAYFFPHYQLFSIFLINNPCLWNRKTLVWYTHPKGIMEDDEFVAVMNCSTKMISACSQFADRMIETGVKSEKVSFVLGGGADPNLFKSHPRSQGTVGFCSAFYDRKNPQLMEEIVKRLPHRKFILLGRNWQQYEGFATLVALDNFSYIEAPYSDYPQYYQQMDIFVSPSKLEGGPVPLIEAMMSNIFPVASSTGFTPDLITHGENGFIFETDSSAEEVCQLIEKAFTLFEVDIRKTVNHLTWKRFALEIQKIIEE